jgi:tetratricopeptide (TPR) repeat protein
VRGFLVLLFCFPLAFGIREAAAATQDPASDPDRLYADRVRLGSATDAASIWEMRLASNPQDFESAWKLARACYWLGGHVAADARRMQYERGITAATSAVRISPGRAEGHFWMAANMGAMAESFGLRAGLKYRGQIRSELETVLKIDPAFLAGSADRALGRWYLKVPGLFGGSKQKSVEHLQRSLMHDPRSTASHFFLAETFVEMNRKDEARRELQQVLDAPANPEWLPEDDEFKQKAAVLLNTLRAP